MPGPLSRVIEEHRTEADPHPLMRVAFQAMIQAAITAWVPPSFSHGSLGELTADDHPQYLTVGRATARFAVSEHLHRHGGLDGLTADDHPQYLTPGRGDARYLQLTGGTVSGSLIVAPVSSGEVSIGGGVLRAGTAVIGAHVIGAHVEAASSFSTYWNVSGYYGGGEPEMLDVTNTVYGGMDAAIRFRQSTTTGVVKTAGVCGVVQKQDWSNGDLTKQISDWYLALRTTTGGLQERLRVCWDGQMFVPGVSFYGPVGSVYGQDGQELQVNVYKGLHVIKNHRTTDPLPTILLGSNTLTDAVNSSDICARVYDSEATPICMIASYADADGNKVMIGASSTTESNAVDTIELRITETGHTQEGVVIAEVIGEGINLAENRVLLVNGVQVVTEQQAAIASTSGSFPYSSATYGGWGFASSQELDDFVWHVETIRQIADATLDALREHGLIDT